MKITPTVGRVVLFRPFDQDYDHDKRHAATIAQVNVDGTLNLGVLNDYGVSQAEQNITLVQGDDKPGYGQAEWIPYQKSQAAKTESVLTVDPFSDEALELALERVLEQRADRQHATNDDGSDNSYPDDITSKQFDASSTENASESESKEEETVGEESLAAMNDAAKNQAEETVEILDNSDAKLETYGEIEAVDIIEEAETVVTEDELSPLSDGETDNGVIEKQQV